MVRINFQELPQGMFKLLMEVEQFIDQSGIEMKLLELIRLRVAQINGCAYCVDMHHKELGNLGETDLRLSSLCVWRDTPYFTEKEIATLTFVEALTQTNDIPITDTVFETLLTHFTKSKISLLTLAIAQINVWTRLMKTFKFEPGKYKVRE